MISYKGLQYSEAAQQVPAWKPGDKVPEGYMVVFGKLRKSKIKRGDHYSHLGSTHAWNQSYKANQLPHGSYESAQEHHLAHSLHAGQYQSSLERAKRTKSPEMKKKLLYTAALHKKAAKDHYQKHLDSYEARMQANPTVDRKLNPHGENELPHHEKILKEKKVLS